MKRTRFDAHQRAAGAQQPAGLVEDRSERPLVDHVVEHKPVEHHVERQVGKSQLPGAAGQAAVERAVLHQRRGLHVVELRAGHPPRGAREEVAAGVPAAPHGEHVAAPKAEPVVEQLALAPEHVVVLELRGRSARGKTVEQVVGVELLAHRRSG